MMKDKIKNAIYLVICVVLIGALVLLAAPKLLGWERLVILSDSMKPTYVYGDIIWVRPCQIQEVEVGDVISFSDRSGVSTTHRVVGVDENHRLITKGDANVDQDAYLVDEKHLYGEVVGKIPRIGKIAIALQKFFH